MTDIIICKKCGNKAFAPACYNGVCDDCQAIETKITIYNAQKSVITAIEKAVDNAITQLNNQNQDGNKILPKTSITIKVIK